jgi:DHA3 family macrolide efflux protein-like MFS transporter
VALLLGLSIPLIDGTLMAILQANIAPDMQGRVLTLFGSVVSSTAPIGLLIAGPVADVVGVRPWFIAAGVLTLVITTAGFFVPDFMNVERHPGTPVAPVAESEEPAAQLPGRSSEGIAI